jgi:hypothetical protein
MDAHCRRGLKPGSNENKVVTMQKVSGTTVEFFTTFVQKDVNKMSDTWGFDQLIY